jgi:hypothetical protein
MAFETWLAFVAPSAVLASGPSALGTLNRVGGTALIAAGAAAVTLRAA